MAEALLEGQFFEPDDPRRIEHFHDVGHVGIEGVFGPVKIDQAISQLPIIKLHLDAPGVQIGTQKVGPELAWNQKELAKLLDGIKAQAAAISGEWPAEQPFYVEPVVMEPGAKGKIHADNNDYSGAVGITTLRGTSDLIIVEQGITYPLRPDGGRVVYLDNNRRPFHQGIAGKEGSRYGLVVSKRAKPTV